MRAEGSPDFNGFKSILSIIARGWPITLAEEEDEMTDWLLHGAALAALAGGTVLIFLI
jgi:hypothetical protein